jgi:predicted nucleotidyltransferase
MIDLSTIHLQTVKDILSKYVPHYEIWAFGSRITGKAKPYSDLDLVIISNAPIHVLTLALLKDEFSESTLPFKVDILDWSQLTPEFKQIIEKQHEIIQKR